MKQRDPKKLQPSTGIRTFEAVQYVSGPLGGTLEDWPAQIQDAIWKALDVASGNVQLPLTIVHALCDKDHDATDPNKTWYIHVVASEVVVAYEPKGTVH